MNRYLVRRENVPVGEVEADTVAAAVDLAYGLTTWNPRDAMSLLTLPKGLPTMHILFDTTNGRALARHASARALSALHYIQFANVDSLILRVGENRSYTPLTQQQIQSIIAYAGGTPAASGEYGDDIRAMRALLENSEWLLLPFTVEELNAQAFAIDANDARPMAFDPGKNAPQLLQRWTSEPQVNRKRCDSSYWVNFAAGEPSGQSATVLLPESGGGATVRKRNTPPVPNQEESSMASTKPAAKKAAKKAAVKKSAPAKTATKTATKKTAAAPAKKAASSGQEERNGIKRPRAGGNTAHVWDACDALKTKKGSCPTFKEVDEYIEKKNADIPTATRRSNYAVWRKFNGISGRVS